MVNKFRCFVSPAIFNNKVKKYVNKALIDNIKFSVIILISHSNSSD